MLMEKEREREKDAMRAESLCKAQFCEKLLHTVSGYKEGKRNFLVEASAQISSPSHVDCLLSGRTSLCVCV